jgi:hypothetical protein
VPELKGRCVIVNHAHKFLSFDKRNWVKTDNSFYVGGGREALATARALPAQNRETGLYIVTDYGYADEVWWKVSAGRGTLERLDCPPALAVDATGVV